MSSMTAKMALLQFTKLPEYFSADVELKMLNAAFPELQQECLLTIQPVNLLLENVKIDFPDGQKVIVSRLLITQIRCQLLPKLDVSTGFVSFLYKNETADEAILRE